MNTNNTNDNFRDSNSSSDSRDPSVDSLFVLTQAHENVVNKDWAAGSTRAQDALGLVFSLNPFTKHYGLTAQCEGWAYPPAMSKVIDEIIVNTLDQFVRCVQTPITLAPTETQCPRNCATMNLTRPHVTCISVDYSPTTNMITVRNDGPGVKVGYHEAYSKEMGRPMTSIDLIFGKLYQGSNTVKQPAAIIGGTNGMGATITCYFSSLFCVDTVDATTKQRCQQKWVNGLAPNQAIITPCTSRPYTEVSFQINQAHFTGIPTAEISRVISKLVVNRMATAAMYLTYLSRHGFPTCKVLYNGREILSDLTLMAIAPEPMIIIKTAKQKSRTKKNQPDTAAIGMQPQPMYTVTMTNSALLYPWEVTLGIHGRDSQHSVGSGVMILNGMVIDSPVIRRLIVRHICAEVNKRTPCKPATIDTSLVITLVAALQVCYISWKAQSKDDPLLKASLLAGFNMTIPEPLIAHYVERAKIKDLIVAQKKIGKKNTDENYTEARYLSSQHSMLAIIEGNSAKAQFIDAMAAARNPYFNQNYVSLMTTGGVPMNARRKTEMKYYEGRDYFVLADKLRDNIFFNSFLAVTGLDVNVRYTEPKERAALVFKKGIIAVVDEDVDGTGNIFGLLMSMFDLYWPALIESGYICRLETPRMHIYPNAGGQVIDIYTDREYREWSASISSTGEDKLSNYTIGYCKGLGTNTKEELAHCIKGIGTPTARIIYYKPTPTSPALFEAYFGRDADKRKQELSRPLPEVKHNMLTVNGRRYMECDTLLREDVNIFQKDNIGRKIDSYIDGFNEVGRKIYDATIEVSAAKTPVVQLASIVKTEEAYHHGDESLTTSIVLHGFRAPGFTPVPLILIYGNSGSRTGGPDCASPARYLNWKPNPVTRLIFRKEDYSLLTFREDDGYKIEPKFFVPIIPMAVLTSKQLPAHGWKLEKSARDIMHLIARVKLMILTYNSANSPTHHMPELLPYTRDWHGTVLMTDRGELSVGVFTLHAGDSKIPLPRDPESGEWILPSPPPATLQARITELPQGVWTVPYTQKIRKLAYVRKVYNDPHDDAINIIVILDPAILEHIRNMYVHKSNDENDDSTFTDFDSASNLAYYLDLVKHRKRHLNHLGKDGELLTFTRYVDILAAWFPLRREYYALRVRKYTILLKLRIVKWENIYRYTGEAPSICRLTRAAAEELLTAEKYVRLDTQLLEHGKARGRKEFVAEDQLEEQILRGPSATFKYLLSLPDYNKTTEKRTKIKAELDKARQEYDMYMQKSSTGKFPGADIWLSELRELEIKLHEAYSTNWFDTSKTYTRV